MKAVTSKSLKDTEEIARSVLSLIKPAKVAAVIALYGDLGSGKTAFVQAVARILGISEPITSPTFVIQKRYPIEYGGFKDLYHLDCYRLKESGDLEALGFCEIMRDSENIIFIEWAERVEELLPKNATKIQFKFIDDRTREITFME